MCWEGNLLFTLISAPDRSSFARIRSSRVTSSATVIRLVWIWKILLLVFSSGNGNSIFRSIRPEQQSQREKKTTDDILSGSDSEADKWSRVSSLYSRVEVSGRICLRIDRLTLHLLQTVLVKWMTCSCLKEQYWKKLRGNCFAVCKG